MQQPLILILPLTRIFWAAAAKHIPHVVCRTRLGRDLSSGPQARDRALSHIHNGDSLILCKMGN